MSLADGKPLKFNYDGKKDNDNLESSSTAFTRAGQDIKVKIDYTTNYVNKADADTAIGSFGRGIRFIKPTADDPNKPRQIWSQGESEFNRYWFPSYDTPNDFRTTGADAQRSKSPSPSSRTASSSKRKTTATTRGPFIGRWTSRIRII